jgi:hypothetical protein
LKSDSAAVRAILQVGSAAERERRLAAIVRQLEREQAELEAG